MKYLGFFLLLLMGQQCLGDMLIKDAWSRATPPGSPMGAAYMVLENDGEEALKITSLSSGIAGFTEIHETTEVDGVARMREVNPLVIPANGSVTLAPGGKHVMLMRLKDALKPGSTYELRLMDDQGREYQTSVLVGGFGQMEMPERE